MAEADDILIRPAAVGDAVFLRRVYASSRAAEVAAFGWERHQTDEFLAMQFSIRARAYAMQFPAADNYVILLGGEPAGQMIVDRSGSGILLVDIAVLPEFRGRGIATHLIGELQAEARSFGRGVTLQVDRGNTPARSLYERLGFTVVDDDDEIDLVMEWRAAT